jgi:hypothetical protein
MQTKVSYVDYQDAKYLVFDDVREPNVGDWVLHPFSGGCGKVSQIHKNYDMSFYDFISIEGVVPMLKCRNRQIVAVRWHELRDDDKALINENTECFVTEENGRLSCYDDGKVILTIQRK